MQIRELTLFLDLIKTGSFSQTAKNHFRTQPAVSIAIRKLEEELGISLFKRYGHQIKLTPEGEILKDSVLQITSRVDDLFFQSSLLAHHPKGHVHFSAIHSVGLYELDSIIKTFIKKYRDIRLHIHYHRAEQIYADVIHHEVDFGIVAYPDPPPECETIPFDEDEMVLISAPKSEAARQRQIDPEWLSNKSFVTFSAGLPTRLAIDRYVTQQNIRVMVRFEDENIEMLKKAVEVGIGVALVPSKSVRREKRSGNLIVSTLKGKPLKRPTGIVRLKNYSISQAAGFFLKELLKKP